MRYTLNQIIRDLNEFVDQHGQLNQFLMKDPYELLNDHESRFPVIDAVLRPINFRRERGRPTVKSFNFDLFFLDLVHKDLSNEFEVLSDMEQCAFDLITYFNQEQFADKFQIGLNGLLTPEYGVGDNEMTGWRLSISFNVIDLNDSCSIPTV